MKRILAFFVLMGLIFSKGLQPQNKSLSKKELAFRLKELKKELREEHKGLHALEKAYQKELINLQIQRRKFASKLLEEQIHLETLKKKNEIYKKKSQILQKKSEHFQELYNRFIQESKAFAEHLEIHLKEIPASQESSKLARSIAQKLTKENSPQLNLQRLFHLTNHTHKNMTSISLKEVKIRTATGLLEEVSLLSIGHVGFSYMTKKERRIGFALSSPVDASGYRWSEDIPASAKSRLRKLMEKIKKKDTDFLWIPMDISGKLRVDTLLRQKQKNWFKSGGPVMYPILAVAILGILLILERAWWLYFRNREKNQLIQNIMEYTKEQKYEGASEILRKEKGAVFQTLLACLNRRERGVSAMEDSIQEQLLHELPGLRRFMGGLATLASVAPLLGLLGTVTGIIETFGVIQGFGNTNPSLMAGGISEALVTTASGLIVAIPIILLRSLLFGRMEKIISDAEKYAASLLNLLSGEKR